MPTWLVNYIIVDGTQTAVAFGQIDAHWPSAPKGQAEVDHHSRVLTDVLDRRGQLPYDGQAQITGWSQLARAEQECQR